MECRSVSFGDLKCGRSKAKSFSEHREEQPHRFVEVDQKSRVEIKDEAEAGEKNDFLQVTLDDFRAALENFPTAERFILKETPDGAIRLVPEEEDLSHPSASRLEDKIATQAFQQVLQAEFSEIDFSSFFENENFSSPVLEAKKIKEILIYCEQQSESIIRKRKLYSSKINSTASLSSLQKVRKGTLTNRKSWDLKSVMMPTIGFFLSYVAKTAAHPFTYCTPLCYPNGSKMGLHWSYFPNFQAYNVSQNQLNLIPSSCILADRLYHQAYHAATKASEACFQNLEHPNITQQKTWEDIFLQSIPLKENWMASEALCSGALNQLQKFNFSQHSLSEAFKAAQQRQEEWMDAARWHPSTYTEEFQPDLYEYSHACVVDAAEEEGPEEGDKIQQIMLKIFSKYYPFICIEKTIKKNTSISRKKMIGDHLIVTLRGEEDPKDFLHQLLSLNIPLTIEQASPYEPIYELRLKEPSLKSFFKILQASSEIALISEPDYLAYSSVGSSVMPNDPHYKGQSSLASINVSTAWNKRKTSANVITTIIDSGMLPHEDLNENIWNNSNPSIHYKSYEHKHGFTGKPTFNITADDNHGRHCSGIIGAVGNNNLGITGITWKTQLMFCKAAVKINNNIAWPYQAMMNCIDHVWRHNASIINLSCNDDAQSKTVFNALKRARDHGVILVTSSGNDGKNLDQYPIYPAYYAKSPQNPTGLDNIVVVGAVNDRDELAPFSNYGPNTVHLAAPGVNVLSTVVIENATSSYQRMSGTSMAAPHVAGVLALMKEHFPDKSHAWLIEKLLNATDRIPSLTNKTIYGRLNAARALEPIHASVSKDQTCPAPLFNRDVE